MQAWTPDAASQQTVEAELLVLWKELLATPAVGVDDDFFALGGTDEHSSRLFDVVERVLGERLRWEDVAGVRSVRNLAQALLARLVAQARTSTVRPEPPRQPGSSPSRPPDVLQDRLAFLWETLLRRSGIGVDDDFMVLGGTRQLLDVMFDEVASLCGEQLQPADVEGGMTIRRLAYGLVARIPQALVLEIQHGTVGCAPLFFSHGDLGGGGYYVRELARGLGVERPVYVLQPHGLHGEDMPPSVEQMAAEYLDVLAVLAPTGPVVVGGHCLGGIL